MTEKASLRIYYLMNMRFPTEKAHGYQVAQMVQAFEAVGIPTELWVPYRRNTKELEKVCHQKYYNLRKSLKVKIIRALDFFPLFAKLPKLQFICFFLHLFSFALFSLWALRKINGEGALVYLRDPYLFKLIGPSLRKRGFKIALELHSLSSQKGRLIKQGRTLLKADFPILITAAMAKLLKETLEVDSSLFKISHDAVDMSSFLSNKMSVGEARRRLGISFPGPILSFVGKFHTNGMEKGIPEILESAKITLKQHDVLYYFVGGPMEMVKSYQKKIKELGLPLEKFVFLEKKPVQEVPLFLKASTLLLMPHPDNFFYRYCVSPLKLFEYMASERPIIASSLPSICEVLNESNSCLGDPGSPKAIASNVEKLLKGESLRKSLAENALKDVSLRTWGHRASDLKRHFLENPYKS